MVQHLASLTVQCLVLLILPNLGKKKVATKVDNLSCLSGLLKRHLKVLGLTLLKGVMNAVHSAYMNELLKESKRDFHLD